MSTHTHPKTPLVLASASPRRLQLLEGCGFDVRVRRPDVDEAMLPGESPVAMVQRLAIAKARTVAEDTDAPVVAADTTVVIDGESLAKPADGDDARRMLRQLAGRTHEVFTGWCVRHRGSSRSGAVRTEVALRALTDQEIAVYVATGDPLDKAGSYGIQGLGGSLVDTVRGSYPNVVGLPVAEVVAAIRELG